MVQPVIVPPLKTDPVYLSTSHAAAALRSGLGIHIEFVKSAAEVVTRMQLTPVSRGGALRR